jgi:hypothetical protein
LRRDPLLGAGQGQIQTAERIAWMTDLDKLPQFERFPGG